MTRTRIKICGITNREDALEAIAAGADALGFVFVANSPRQVDAGAAAEIIRCLPPLVATVGVFVDADRETIWSTAQRCGLGAVQLHGAESPEFCRGWPGVRVIKAFRIRDRDSLVDLPRFATDAWLLDTHVPGRSGGTGTAFDWSLARETLAWGRPIILAGGLHPGNVASAIEQVRPYAVDVSSGVESAPGKKDADKMRRFAMAVAMASKSDPAL
ncbi:MAG TPA: phosphoribosylanthranilate isomerase [Candidatus Paceibacterota bacterium]|nr:phosphoribosylanthranilate isomerase [Verrucomicrobiota bacterium]HRY48380.1 phosphoribosylanthranilate isomerase [Candidatus Paceibacterota bacterium]